MKVRAKVLRTVFLAGSRSLMCLEQRALERAVGDGVREPEDQAGPCRLLSGF